MSDWTGGYIADTPYTYGYYPELNPLRVQMAFLSAGLVPPPKFEIACELGFGQGLSICTHAAATSTEWWGNDFNPQQVSFARELARSGSTNVVLSDYAFDEFCRIDEMPEFDFIGLHGIWSWISDANRLTIVDFVRRKLKVGGVLYVSYNTQPGWASLVPLRHLMTQHAHTIGSAGAGIVSRVDEALNFCEKLFALNPLYAVANPVVLERFREIKSQNRQYLAHEYFNRDWEPMPFSKMTEWLAPAKMSFACSAHYLDHIDQVNLLPDQSEFLRSITSDGFRETARDYLVNQQFRRDYWVKGRRELTSLQQIESWRQLSVILTRPRASVSMTTVGAAGKVTLQHQVYDPIIDFMADYKPKLVSEIEAVVRDKGVNTQQLFQALMVLAGKGDVGLALGSVDQRLSAESSRRSNDYLLDRARGGGETTFLASPVIGGGVLVQRFDQLFMLSIRRGLEQKDWCRAVWQILQTQGERIVDGGKVIDSADDSLTYLDRLAHEFATVRLPLYRSLGVI